VVSQYDKDDVEAVGLVKFDFLGLTTLTILDRAVNYIRALDPAMSGFDLATLPLDDRASYELLTKARTVAVFQLESRGMQGMLKDARPDRFEDIIALVALYRPGPMDLIPDFCKRKHGEKFEYPDPVPKAFCLKPTASWFTRSRLCRWRRSSGDTLSAVRIYCAGPWVRKKRRKWPSIEKFSGKVRKKWFDRRKGRRNFRSDGKVCRLWF
jgi:hypothetical protein